MGSKHKHWIASVRKGNIHYVARVGSSRPLSKAEAARLARTGFTQEHGSGAGANVHVTPSEGTIKR